MPGASTLGERKLVRERQHPRRLTAAGPRPRKTTSAISAAQWEARQTKAPGFGACRPRASACASASERSTGTPNPFEQLGTPKPFDQSLSCPSLTTYKSSGAFPTLSAEGSVSAAGEFALLNSTPPPPPGSTPAHSWPTWSGKELRRLIWANGHSRSRALTRYLLSLLGRKMLELARSAESTRSQPVQPSEASHPAQANRLGPSESCHPSWRG